MVSIGASAGGLAALEAFLFGVPAEHDPDMAFVLGQHPESTEYDGMPRNAIAIGLVKDALPSAEMPAQLMIRAPHAFGGALPHIAAQGLITRDTLEKNGVLLRDQTGHEGAKAWKA